MKKMGKYDDFGIDIGNESIQYEVDLLESISNQIDIVDSKDIQRDIKLDMYESVHRTLTIMKLRNWNNELRLSLNNRIDLLIIDVIDKLKNLKIEL